MSTAELFSVGAGAFSGGLRGVKGTETMYAQQLTGPSTAVASSAVIVDGSGATPTVSHTMAQTAPALSAGGTYLQSYATAAGGADDPTKKANSVMVARPAVLSAPLAYPAGSAGGLITLTGANPAPVGALPANATTAIVCPTATAASQIRFWLMAAGAGVAIVYPTITLNAAGTGFSVTTAANNTWGYEVMYA